MDNSAFRFDNIFLQSHHPQLSDGRLCTEDGHSFNIHRYVLASSSEYFCALYCDFGKGREAALIPGITGDILSNILTYIYTRNLYLTKANLCDLFVAADYLLLDELLRDIKREMSPHLSISNCLSLFATAMLLTNHSDVLRDSFRFIQTHFEEIVESDDSELSELPLEAFKKILSDKNLCAKDENTIWLAIVKWVQAEIFDRQSEVPDLLMHLTIRDVDETLASRILEHGIVASNPVCSEIIQMKLSNSFDSNFRILFHYFLAHPQPTLPLYRIRQPSKLNFTARWRQETFNTELYVTYDENIDLWRKISEYDILPDFLVPMQCYIYAFDTGNGQICRYNLIEKEWTQMTDFENRVSRCSYILVKLDGFIYLLGGEPLNNFGTSYDVLACDPEINVFSEVAPMFPVDEFEAVTLGKSIFVIGCTTNDMSMVAQVYQPETDFWLQLPSPLIPRHNFAVVEYHDRIFVLGGGDDLGSIKTVEVFDPLKNEWTFEKELPHSYLRIKANVLFDTLIVYSYYGNSLYPPVQWNEGPGCWIPIEKSSPLYELKKCFFFTLDDPESINMITRENREPGTNFLKSSFLK